MPPIPSGEKPLKLPPGEKVETLEYVDLYNLLTELKKEKFTGSLIIEFPDYGLQKGGSGKILFIVGDIIASSFESGEKVLVRTDAIENMINLRSTKTGGKIKQHFFDDTDIWLAIERNKLQLFEYEPPVRTEVKKQGETQLVEKKYGTASFITTYGKTEEEPQKKTEEEPQKKTEEDHKVTSFFTVTFNKKTIKLSREELFKKYKLHEVTETDADNLLKRALED